MKSDGSTSFPRLIIIINIMTHSAKSEQPTYGQMYQASVQAQTDRDILVALIEAQNGNTRTLSALQYEIGQIKNTIASLCNNQRPGIYQHSSSGGGSGAQRSPWQRQKPTISPDQCSHPFWESKVAGQESRNPGKTYHVCPTCNFYWYPHLTNGQCPVQSAAPPPAPVEEPTVVGSHN